MQVKKAGLTLYVEPTKLVGDVAVGLSFPLACNGCSFQKLQSGCSCCMGCFPAGSEEAALAFSLVVAVRQALCSDVLLVSKTKVAEVKGVVHNGLVGINWKVKGTGSAVRKSIGLALKALDPARMFPAYSRCIKTLNGSVDKDVFAYVADAAAKSIKSDLTVGIVGNIKTDKDKISDMIEVLAKKHQVSSVSGSKSKPSGHTNCEHSEHTELKVSGWASAVLSDYIQTKVKGLIPVVCDKHLLLPVKPAQWHTLADKLKKGVKDYATAKYSRVGSDLPAAFGYLTLSNGSLSADDVKSAIGNKLSVSSIESAISKNL